MSSANLSLLFVSRLRLLFIIIIIIQKTLLFLHQLVLGTYSALHLPQEMEFGARSDAQFS